jgi:hypothetical protein
MGLMVLDCSNTRIVGLNPAWNMDILRQFFCVVQFLCR